jgi:hypothetical protein
MKIEINDEEIEIPIKYKRNKDSNYEKEIYEEEKSDEKEYDNFEEPKYKEFMSISENKGIDLGK